MTRVQVNYMRFFWSSVTLAILMLPSVLLSATCIQGCEPKGDALFIPEPRQSKDNPKRFLNAELPSVKENTNISFTRSQSIGFKKHGLEIVRTDDGFPARTGKTSFKFEVRNGDCGYNPPPGWNECKTFRDRHELSQHTLLSDEVWLTYSLHLDKDYAPVEKWSDYAYSRGTVLGQIYPREIENTGRINEGPQFLFYAHHSGYLISNFITNEHTELPQILPLDQMIGQWNDIMIHMNAVSSSQGFFRVYVNGKSDPVYSYEGGITKPNDKPTFKFGIYRYGLDPEKEYPSQVVYYDNVFVFDKCEDIPKELKFSCTEIKKQEQANYQNREPKMTACGSQLCPVRYGRAEYQIIDRLECYFAGVPEDNAKPTKEQITTFAQSMNGWDDFRMKLGYFYWNVFTEETMAAHGDAMVNIMNLYHDEAETFICSTN